MKKKLTKTILILPVALLFYCGQTVPEFSGENSFAYLEKQVSFGPRNPMSTGHEECKNWLVSELKKFAGRVVEQPFMHYDPRINKNFKMTNIVASFNLKAERRIVLCAHWDTRPVADMDVPENSDKPILGANDGASGVAVLLEIARVMKSQPTDVGVDIVLFDGEDYGPEGKLDEYFLGSKYFAKNLNDYKPVFGILLDMVGDAQLNLPIEYQSQYYARNIVDKVWAAAKELGYTQFKNRVGSAVNDDHLALIDAGIPTIDIIDFEYPDNTHKYWHTMEDTPDKCSPQSLKVVGQTVLQVIYNEAG
ncbi:MAG: M28 family peptidase [Calditrichaeota bacterium]|nr:MAG: glutamine cyclotransferase [Calditrichota bacterium]MBL1207487.1 M28 family peptidase [Calditrichota bacterium]NOG47319.1 M28 family peptidase [Calditrichota bacterium]